MNIRRLSGLLKELRKIFRRRRKLGLSFVFLFILAGSTYFGMLVLAGNGYIGMQAERDADSFDLSDQLRRRAIAAWTTTEPEQETLQTLADYLDKHEVVRNVHILKIYVCGEENQSLGKLKSEQILDLLKQHPNWLVAESDEEKITFYEYVEDLSDRCKESAYIGIDEMDQLTLFEGVPAYNNAIRTFFQIDVEYLKTSLPQEAIDSLYSGIRVRDLAQYTSVISTFSQFAVEEAERTAGTGIVE